MRYNCKSCGSRVLEPELAADGHPVRCSNRLCPNFAIEPAGDWYDAVAAG